MNRKKLEEAVRKAIKKVANEGKYQKLGSKPTVVTLQFHNQTAVNQFLK